MAEQSQSAPDSTKKVLEDLIERFSRNLDAYKSPSYKEDQCRIEFINPFFESLGWDMANKRGRAEQYKEVIHEDTLNMSGLTKAPDYSFRIGGTRKFFLEAKKPAVNIKTDAAPAHQLRRYAWSAKLPLSILTDFEEFAVYDCRIRPGEKDKADAARIRYLTYDQYLSELNWIYATFSNEAVLQGSFDRFAESTKGKKGSTEVDAEFLKEIESWRFALAKNIALRNPALNVHQLNDAVQRTIDRIIFLRMAEDRGIEKYQQLWGTINGANIYKRLIELFYKSEDKYNSGLFDFEKDSFTAGLKIEDKALADIISDLYYPKCPYEFSVLGADTLGNIYEQFLGKVIRLTAGHQAKVEEKPEVKKAGGVYYTPKYIVDYIVKNTVGKLVENVGAQLAVPLKPDQISKLKILDPACGSGSFLLGAYQYLLDYHIEWYKKHYTELGKKALEDVYQGPRGQWLLTTSEKKRILLNNIFGVDIDPQAVEVSKLSLLLKVLENESEESIKKQLQLFHERALPDLDNNIKCGNSLIGSDFYKNQQINLFDEEQKYKINAFDWETEFPEIFKKGGFDVVIGNPPYLGFQGFKEDKNYLKNEYSTAEGRFDFYIPFLEKSLRLLIAKGLLGFICPTNFTKRNHGKKIRSLLLEKTRIIEITDFEDKQIFQGATNYTGIFIFQASEPNKEHCLAYRKSSLDAERIQVLQSALTEDVWVFRDSNSEKIVNKIIKNECVSTLETICAGISEGIVTGENSVFLLNNATSMSIGLEDGIAYPCIRGREIRRYYSVDAKELVIYPYQLENGQTKVITEKVLRDKFPNAWSYLESRKKDLSGRPYFENSSKQWYELWCQRDLNLIASQKIIVPELAETNRFSISNDNQFYGDTVCGIVLRPDTNETLRYILGLLNSKLIEFFYKKTTVPKAGNFFIYKTMFLKKIPIRRIDFSNPEEESTHQHIDNLVTSILAMHKKLTSSKTPDEKTRLEREIKATDNQIDQLVYRLYGLTEEEIKIVEGKNV